MRLINKEVIIEKREVVTRNEIATEEVLGLISEHRTVKYIEVDVVLLSAEGKALTTERYEIAGEKYDLLMSELPDFAPGKPQNEYRTCDLWHIIDLIRTEQES